MREYHIKPQTMRLKPASFDSSCHIIMIRQLLILALCFVALQAMGVPMGNGDCGAEFKCPPNFHKSNRVNGVWCIKVRVFFSFIVVELAKLSFETISTFSRFTQETWLGGRLNVNADVPSKVVICQELRVTPRRDMWKVSFDFD